MATIKEVLEGLKFVDYSSITVIDDECSPLGGGFVESVIKRFGDMEIFKSRIVEGHLRIYVKSNTN